MIVRNKHSTFMDNNAGLKFPLHVDCLMLMTAEFFVLLSCFIIAEYALSYQNTSRNSYLTFMSIRKGENRG